MYEYVLSYLASRHRIVFALDSHDPLALPSLCLVTTTACVPPLPLSSFQLPSIPRLLSLFPVCVPAVSRAATSLCAWSWVRLVLRFCTTLTSIVPWLCLQSLRPHSLRCCPPARLPGSRVFRPTDVTPPKSCTALRCTAPHSLTAHTTHLASITTTTTSSSTSTKRRRRRPPSRCHWRHLQHQKPIQNSVRTAFSLLLRPRGRTRFPPSVNDRCRKHESAATQRASEPLGAPKAPVWAVSVVRPSFLPLQLVAGLGCRLECGSRSPRNPKPSLAQLLPLVCLPAARTWRHLDECVNAPPVICP